jgi:hypothetical protein
MACLNVGLLKDLSSLTCLLQNCVLAGYNRLLFHQQYAVKKGKRNYNAICGKLLELPEIFT